MVVKKCPITEQKNYPFICPEVIDSFSLFCTTWPRYFFYRDHHSRLKLYFITNVNKRKDFERKDKKNLNSEENYGKKCNQ